jgi:hypothetical protein
MPDGSPPTPAMSASRHNPSVEHSIPPTASSVQQSLAGLSLTGSNWSATPYQLPRPRPCARYSLRRRRNAQFPCCSHRPAWNQVLTLRRREHRETKRARPCLPPPAAEAASVYFHAGAWELEQRTPIACYGRIAPDTSEIRSAAQSIAGIPYDVRRQESATCKPPHRQVANQKVTGPSLVRLTCISAPNRPVCT